MVVIRSNDIKDFYIKMLLIKEDIFNDVQLESAYFAKTKELENFDKIVITNDERDLFLHELNKATQTVANYFKDEGLDRQGHIEDDSKPFVIGSEIPTQSLKTEEEENIIFYISDNRRLSDNSIKQMLENIQTWLTSAVLDKMLNGEHYKGERKPSSINELLEKQMFYLRLK